VPYICVGKKVTIKNNSKILKIYDESYNEVAVHTLSDGTGEFITNKAHNPRLTQTDYENKSLSIGSNVYEFYNKLRESKPHHYHRMIAGIFDLAKKYGNNVVDLSCKRANEFNSISYLSVKKICENGLYIDKNISPDESVKCGGYCHDLKEYDFICEK
jgi:hypothetical protein